MKTKLLLLSVLLAGFCLPLIAQDDETNDVTQFDNETSVDQFTIKSKIFRFIYVAPDANMSQQQLIAALNDHRNHVVSDESPAIFYLPSAEQPLIVKFNLDGSNEDDFDGQLLYNLRETMSWPVNTNFDRKKILELLTEYDFVDSDGNFKYEKVEMIFHVGKKFWDRGNNEAIIAALFFELNASKYIESGKMQFNVFFRCPPSKGSLDREKPFGDMNLDDINQRVIPKVEN